MSVHRQHLIQFYDDFIGKSAHIFEAHWTLSTWNVKNAFIFFFVFIPFCSIQMKRIPKKFASFHEWAIVCKLINRFLMHFNDIFRLVSRTIAQKMNGISCQYSTKINGFCRIFPVLRRNLRTSKWNEKEEKNMRKIFVMASFKEKRT